MAVSISPYGVTDMWTHAPEQTNFEVTAGRLQMLLFNIFQVLETECKSPPAAERDLQEADTLTSEIKMLGKELEKKLRSFEQHICEPEQKVTAEVEALQKQVAGIKTELQVTTQEKKHLENLVAVLETNLRTASLDIEKLKSLMETMKAEQKDRKKTNKAIDRIFEIPEEAFDKELQGEFESLKKKLKLHRDLEDKCEEGKQKLWDRINSLKTQQASLMERNVMLDASLNLSLLSSSVFKDELQKSEKVNQELKQLTKDDVAFRVNMIDFKEYHSQSCARLERNGLAYQVDKLNESLREHTHATESVFVPTIPAFGVGSVNKLRKIQRGRSKERALIEVCKEGDADGVLVLLKNNANPNDCDKQGLTPLQWAAKNDHMSVAEVLIQHGRIVNVDNPVAGCMTATPLHVAAAAGNTQMAELFLDLGADIHAKTRDASTPLHLAVNEDRETMVILLLSRGADVKKKNHIGNTPMDLAKAKKYRNIQNLLIKAKRRGNK